MGYLHESFGYRIVKHLGDQEHGLPGKVVAYFDTEERAIDYLAYLNTTKKEYERYIVQETPCNV